MAPKPVMDWLLEERQPSVRYYALTDLLGRKEDEREVRAARASIARVGWAKSILSRQKPAGYWERRPPKTALEYIYFLWFPEFQSTIWNAAVLADLGLTSSDPRIRKLADRIFEYKMGYSTIVNIYHEEMCAVGTAARTLTRFGYGDDPRITKLYDWMLEDQRRDGGWNCSQGTPGTLDAWEPLSAFAAVPKSKRSKKMEESISKGAEFYLKRNLFKEGSKYRPWFRFHYPTHYIYDVLVGLDLMTSLGYAGDPRLEPALKILRDKRRKDGTWVIDAVHPDAPAGVLHLHGKVNKPLVLEKPGDPSKWITLTALRVLKRVEDAN